jgi:hypothetical protein
MSIIRLVCAGRPLIARLLKDIKGPHSSVLTVRQHLLSAAAPLPMSINLLTATVSELQEKLSEGKTTSKALVQLYLDQITNHNDYLKAVIATAPEDALKEIANDLDNERASGAVRGPLHGIPILIKVRRTFLRFNK